MVCPSPDNNLANPAEIMENGKKRRCFPGCRTSIPCRDQSKLLYCRCWFFFLQELESIVNFTFYYFRILWPMKLLVVCSQSDLGDLALHISNRLDFKPCIVCRASAIKHIAVGSTKPCVNDISNRTLMIELRHRPYYPGLKIFVFKHKMPGSQPPSALQEKKNSNKT